MAFWHKLLGGDQTGHSIDQIKQNLREGKALMLDVRGQEERDQVHLKNSIFVPIANIKDLPADTRELPALPKDKVIYCH